ncbi:heat shock protein [Seminavis robusta]|uniref:Heat shock protein n=1 Tax=Seminavis robusta TaxID=568900 RepID=A0A9N8EB75_9STRA|nr:heat shock protein [Seminavis robusta]|eukprot:Sro699_g189380.1 heat shock protein (114) ;mRNA; r:6771-7112
MQGYMKAKAVWSGQDARGMGNFDQAVLEINPNNPIVQDLDRMVKFDNESNELENSGLLMYGVASMTSSFNVGDVKGFTQGVMSLMNDQQNEDSSTPKDAEVILIPEIIPEVPV